MSYRQFLVKNWFIAFVVLQVLFWCLMLISSSSPQQLTHAARPHYAIMSTNSVPQYEFLAPLAALAWKRLDIIAVVVISPDVPELVRNAFAHFGGEILTVEDDWGEMQGNLMQNARALATLEGRFDEFDWITLADADIFPVNADFFEQAKEPYPHHLNIIG